MDGSGPFPDEDTPTRPYRDELACAGLQLEARNQSAWDYSVDAGDEGLKPGLSVEEPGNADADPRRTASFRTLTIPIAARFAQSPRQTNEDTSSDQFRLLTQSHMGRLRPVAARSCRPMRPFERTDGRSPRLRTVTPRPRPACYPPQMTSDSARSLDAVAARHHSAGRSSPGWRDRCSTRTSRRRTR